jgi:hypothetical protein
MAVLPKSAALPLIFSPGYHHEGRHPGAGQREIEAVEEAQVGDLV